MVGEKFSKEFNETLEELKSEGYEVICGVGCPPSGLLVEGEASELISVVILVNFKKEKALMLDRLNPFEPVELHPNMWGEDKDTMTFKVSFDREIEAETAHEALTKLEEEFGESNTTLWNELEVEEVD